MSSLLDLLVHPGKPARRRPMPRAAKALLAPGSRLLLIALFALMSLSATEHQAEAQTWSLTKEQRKAYLNYYAPVILKRGDENDNKQGRDWITNFDFDQDGDFSNNRVNWLNVNNYVAASAYGSSTYAHWRIRPTLYTALLEYMEGGSKSLVLLYHVYNAADKDGSKIHDWERIEIVLRGVSGTPGSTGEYVSNVAVTIHGDQIMRRHYDSGLKFMQTATGKHLLIWQADESGDDSPFTCLTRGHELRFVTSAYSWIASQMSSNAQAEVDINDEDEKNVHYVFVPDGSSAAISAWGAKPLNYAAASTLYSGVDNGNRLSWSRVKRITYELQDWADILPTHWQYTTWYKHWLSGDKEVDILLESPIINEAGQPEVSAGMQHFYTLSRDSGSPSLTDGRDAYLHNLWFYGAYAAELEPDCDGGALDFPAYIGSGVDSYGRSRGAASGYYNSHGAYWWQHDYFVHSGVINSSYCAEAGVWLPGAWYTAEQGGFDGRWVQLFDDRPGYEPVAPLSLSVSGNRFPQPYSYETWYAAAAHGTGPYSYAWYRDGYFVGTGNTYSEYVYDTAFQLQVTVTDAAGATATSGMSVLPTYGSNCNPYSGEICQIQ
jgi:hypothetical protein